MNPTEIQTPSKALRVHDISVTLRPGLPSWPGEDFWKLEPVCQMAEGAPCNVSKLAMGCHLGTHVDAPWHFGKSDVRVDQIPLDQMVIRARVIDLTHVEKCVVRADLEGKLDGISAVLFKTRNSGKLEAQLPFDEHFIYPDITAADYLMEQGIRTLGVDYHSVDGYHTTGAPVHHRILKDIFVIEGLDLTGIPAGDYLFVVLPLKIEGSDGAPARAILIEGI